MKKRPFAIIVLISMLPLIVVAVLYLWSGVFSVRSNHVAIGKICNVSITQNWGGRIVLFSNGLSAPYVGSLVNFDEPLTNGAVVSGWGDHFGVYFRRVKQGQVRNWTLMVSIWYAASAAAVYPATFILIKWRRKRSRSVVNSDTPETEAKF